MSPTLANPYNKRNNVGPLERAASILAAGFLTQRCMKTKGMVGVALALGAGELMRRGVTGHCYARDYARDWAMREAPTASQPVIAYKAGEIIEDVVTVRRNTEDLYSFWRKLSNLPQFMVRVEAVKEIDGVRSHWMVRGPAGYRLEWDAEVFRDEPNELIAWRTVGNADIVSVGCVTFKPVAGNRGTEVRVKLQYNPPGGKAVSTLARLLGNAPAFEVRRDLMQFRQLMECGEVISTDGQTSGREVKA